jgi:hypothetical protein
VPNPTDSVARKCKQVNHIRPLSEARTMEEAITLCDAADLEAVHQR